MADGILHFDESFSVDGQLRFRDHKSDVLKLLLQPLFILEDLVFINCYILIKFRELGLSGIAADLHQPMFALYRKLR